MEKGVEASRRGSRRPATAAARAAPAACMPSLGRARFSLAPRPRPPALPTPFSCDRPLAGVAEAAVRSLLRCGALEAAVQLQAWAAGNDTPGAWCAAWLAGGGAGGGAGTVTAAEHVPVELTVEKIIAWYGREWTAALGGWGGGSFFPDASAGRQGRKTWERGGRRGERC